LPATVHSPLVTLGVVYADGWDQAIVNPLTPAQALSRDTAGEPYAVLLLAEGRLHALLHVSWRDDFCHLSRFDAGGRRIATLELRRARDGDLFLFERRTWDGPEDVPDDEFPRLAARQLTRHFPDGRLLEIVEPEGDRGGSRHSQGHGPVPRLQRPDFGRWHALLELAGLDDVEIVDATAHHLPVTSASQPPWRVPRPFAPRDVQRLFVAGTEYLFDDRSMRIEVHEAGVLRMPSGRLVAADPAWLGYDHEPYTVTVDPGTYPVKVSVARFVDDPAHTRVAAARLDITDRPVMAWEMAMRPGQDPIVLGDGEFFGIGVDAGMACFVDADECERLRGASESFGSLAERRFIAIESGAMVAWSSGWGDGAYPTWIGRDAAGEVVCFVADMLLFGPSDDEADQR
jgi:hypothetical protein